MCIFLCHDILSYIIVSKTNHIGIQYYMNMENKTKKIWTGVFIIMFLSIIIVVIGATLLYHEHKSFSIIMSVTGVVASIIGIIVTLVQVSSAINKTEAVRTEVTKNSQEIRAFHSIASFNTESEKVRNILDSLSSKEYRYLWWRIAELKDFLIKQKENPVVSNNKTSPPSETGTETSSASGKTVRNACCRTRQTVELFMHILNLSGANTIFMVTAPV